MEIIPDIETYMPLLTKGASIPRQYFFKVANSLLPTFNEQYMEQLANHRVKHLPEEKKFGITKEVYEQLKSANIVRIGESKAYGGYVIRTKSRKDRKPVKKLTPKFKRPDLNSLFDSYGSSDLGKLSKNTKPGGAPTGKRQSPPPKPGLFGT